MFVDIPELFESDCASFNTLCIGLNIGFDISAVVGRCESYLEGETRQIGVIGDASSSEIDDTLD